MEITGESTITAVGITDAFFEFKSSDFYQEIGKSEEISKRFGEACDSVFAPTVPERRNWVEHQTDDYRKGLRARVEDLDYLGWRALMSRSRDCLQANLNWRNEAEERMPKISTLDLQIRSRRLNGREEVVGRRGHRVSAPTVTSNDDFQS